MAQMAKALKKDLEKLTASNPVEAVAVLREVVKAKPEIEYFRSGGFLNRDYDMGRIYIDLPINEAKKLISKLKAI